MKPLRDKYWPLYFDMAYAAQMQTTAKREKVGCVIVLPSGVILPGWNGQPAGHHTNCCENTPVEEGGVKRMKTDSTVIHAERNAVMKALTEGIKLDGAHLFCTVSPCPGCCQLLIEHGIAAVHFDRHHDDLSGLIELDEAGIEVHPR